MIFIAWGIVGALIWLHGYWFAMRLAAGRFRRDELNAEARRGLAAPQPGGRSFRLNTVEFKRD